MITWNWGVIEFTVCVSGDVYYPLEVLGCCLIAHWDYLCITTYNFVNHSNGKIYVQVNNIYPGTATDFWPLTKKISKISTSGVNFGFKIGSIDMTSTGISVRKEISAHVGEDGNLFHGEKCFYTNATSVDLSGGREPLSKQIFMKSHKHAGANGIYGKLEENYFQGQKSVLTVVPHYMHLPSRASQWH